MFLLLYKQKPQYNAWGAHAIMIPNDICILHKIICITRTPYDYSVYDHHICKLLINFNSLTARVKWILRANFSFEHICCWCVCVPYGRVGAQRIYASVRIGVFGEHPLHGFRCWLFLSPYNMGDRVRFSEQKLDCLGKRYAYRMAIQSNTAIARSPPPRMKTKCVYIYTTWKRTSRNSTLGPLNKHADLYKPFHPFYKQKLYFRNISLLCDI